MTKKILKDILKLYALPLYEDEGEFIDKLASYLHARYQFSELKLVKPSDLNFDVTRLSWDHVVIRTEQSQVVSLSEDASIDNLAIKDIFLRIRLGPHPDRYGRIVIPKIRRHFKKTKDFTLFIKLFKAYLSHQLDLVARLKVVAPPPENVKVSGDDISEQRHYLDVFPQLMPESIKMPQALNKVEKQLIKEMLNRVGGVKIAAAKQLGITERMIGYKIKTLKIQL